MIKDLELTLELYKTIIPRIIDISLGGVNWFSIDQDDSLPDYSRFILNENLGKPSLERIEEEFQEYKQELLNSVYAEIESIWTPMLYPQLGMKALGIDKKPRNYLNEIKELEDSSLAQAVYDAYLIEMDIREQREILESKKQIGQKVRSMCDSALDVIIGYNVARSFTPEQQNQMKAIYADIFQALKDYQPATAKALIQAVEVDDVLTTQSMKDDVLKEL